jgi:hypothetical protein
MKHETNSRVLKRLYFVKLRFLGDSIEEPCTKLELLRKQDITDKLLGINAV